MKIYAVIEVSNTTDAHVLIQDELEKLIKLSTVESTYSIYHAVGPDAFSEIQNQKRRLAGWVLATSLLNAFMKSQNTDKPWFNTQTRSTSVGDVIEFGNQRFMVTNKGFEILQLPEDTV